MNPAMEMHIAGTISCFIIAGSGASKYAAERGRHMWTGVTWRPAMMPAKARVMRERSAFSAVPMIAERKGKVSATVAAVIPVRNATIKGRPNTISNGGMCAASRNSMASGMAFAAWRLNLKNTAAKIRSMKSSLAASLNKSFHVLKETLCNRENTMSARKRPTAGGKLRPAYRTAARKIGQKAWVRSFML